MCELLPDVLSKNLKVVFCGLNPGKRSAKIGCYYTDPKNRFWKVLYEAGFTPKRLEPCNYREVLRYGIGLTDLIKWSYCRNVKPKQEDIKKLREKILKFKPKVLAFNGKSPAEYLFKRKEKVKFGKIDEKIGRTEIFVVPSTSGANANWYKHNHIKYWKNLSDYVKQL